MPENHDAVPITAAAADIEPATAPDGADLVASADAGRTIAFRRSLRASRERRAAARRRRRRLFRGRGGALIATGGLVVLSAGALAQEHRRPAARAASTSVVTAAQRALGIVADGMAGPQTRRAVRRFQRQKRLTVDGVIGPQTLAALGIDRGSSSADGSAPASGDAARQLQSIAACESGGDPTAVSSDGRYRGKYQFDAATWTRMGGSGVDPAAAPEAEQDEIAANLLAQAGTSPWPHCA